MFTREEVRAYFGTALVVGSVVGGIAGLVGGLVWLDDYKDRQKIEAQEEAFKKLAAAMRSGSGNIIIVARVIYDMPATASEFSRQAAWAAYYGWRPVGEPKVDYERCAITQSFVKPLPPHKASR